MSSNEARLFFVITVKGDLGPFSKIELREQLRGHAFAGTDRVRNAFGRPLGSVNDVLGSVSQSNHLAAPAPQHQPAKSSVPWPIIAVAGGMIILVLLLWLLSGGVEQPQPAAPQQPTVRTEAPIPTPPIATPATEAVAAQPPATSDLPAGFSLTDVGDARPKGTAFSKSNVIVISGGGSDIWGNRDECAFLHRTLPDDATLTVEVRQMEETSAWDKVGLMVRASTDPDAVQCSILAIHSGLIQFANRKAKGQDTASTNLEMKTFPIWLRLERRGTRITGSASHDGQTWQQIDSFDLPALAGPTVAGLAVSSHDRSRSNRTVFAGLSVVEGH